MPDFPDSIASGAKTTPTCAACGADSVVQWRRQNAADLTHTDAVYACGPHAITMAAAANVHQASCTAPDPATVPACNCVPIVQPQDPDPTGPTTTLPTGWVVSAS
jgi:hypothetical protein